MLVVALTGDVGAGKTTLAHLWSEEGAALLDADAIVHSLWRDEGIRAAARRRWGDGIFAPGGEILPAEIARLTFPDDEEYRWLCSLLHPPVLRRMEKELERSRGFVVAEIPLLFEVGVPAWVDCIVYVAAEEEARARRNASRGLDLSELALRERHLQPRQEKIRYADVVVSNDGSIVNFLEEGRNLARRFGRLASAATVACAFEREDAAHAAGHILVEERLAACAHVQPIQSVYRWHGRICAEPEWELSLRTFEGLFLRIAERLRGLSAYELPVIECREIRRMNFAALEWLSEACT